ncbi:MAG: hypothetical protein QNJ54_24985 [Prochloraceae cyanobacterium]|nr:hypothetical protein [Prochloraceae cyanobacterium]
MFGKSPKPIQPDIEPIVPDVSVTPEPQPVYETTQPESTFMNDSNLEKSELVNKAETINAVISPYFLVIVGLLLYDKNFFLGLGLLIIGLLSLFRITFQDILALFENIKKFF